MNLDEDKFYNFQNDMIEFNKLIENNYLNIEKVNIRYVLVYFSFY